MGIPSLIHVTGACTRKSLNDFGKYGCYTARGPTWVITSVRGGISDFKSVKTEGSVEEKQSFFQGHREYGRKEVIFPGMCYFWVKPGYNNTTIVALLISF